MIEVLQERIIWGDKDFKSIVHAVSNRDKYGNSLTTDDTGIGYFILHEGKAVEVFPHANYWAIYMDTPNIPSDLKEKE